MQIQCKFWIGKAKNSCCSLSSWKRTLCCLTGLHSGLIAAWWFNRAGSTGQKSRKVKSRKIAIPPDLAVTCINVLRQKMLLLQLLLELLFEDKLENHLKLSFRRNGCVVEHFEKYHFNCVKELKNLYGALLMLKKISVCISIRLKVKKIVCAFQLSSLTWELWAPWLEKILCAIIAGLVMELWGSFRQKQSPTNASQCKW